MVIGAQVRLHLSRILVLLAAGLQACTASLQQRDIKASSIRAARTTSTLKTRQHSTSTCICYVRVNVPYFLWSLGMSVHLYVQTTF